MVNIPSVGAPEIGDISKVIVMKPGMIRFSNGNDLPSYVSADGSPFLFAGRPILVKRIDPSNSTAIVSLFSKNGDIAGEYSVKWDTSGPILLGGFLILAEENSDEETFLFGYATDTAKTRQNTITLITIDGQSFDVPRDMPDPVIAGSPTSPEIYYTVREEGNRRHVRKVGTQNNYLAEYVNKEWRIMLSDKGGNQYLNIEDTTILTGSYFFSDTGRLLEYRHTESRGHWHSFVPARSLPFGDRGDVFNVSYNDRRGVYSGEFHSKNVIFDIDLSGGLRIPHMELNGNVVFQDKNGRIIFPENIGGSIDPSKKIENLRGFSGVTLYRVKGDRDARYTDGKSVFVLVEKDGKIKTYDKSGSPYEGCAVSGTYNYDGGSYNAHYSGKKGEDSVRILTAAGEVLLLPGKEGERVVNPDHRSEVPTTLAQKMNDGFTVVGLHPDKSIIVLQPKGGDSTSSYRYYGIDGQGNLTYIGSKNNIGETKIGLFKTVSSGRTGGKIYPICLGEQGESQAFLLGDMTFLPIILEEGKATLLCLQSDSYRDLISMGNISIPNEWIQDGKIKKGCDLSSLIEKFPGTDTPYIPGKIYFSDIYGREFTPSKIAQAPKLAFGNSRYYVVIFEGSVCLWNPEGDKKIQIPTIHMSRDRDEDPRLPEKISRGANQVYIYPANAEFPENLRMALFLGNTGIPVSSYVWYDPNKNPSIQLLKDHDGYERIFGEQPTIRGSHMIFENNKKTHIFEKETGEAVSVPRYPGLSFGVNSLNKIVHHTPEGPIEYDEGGKPREIVYEGVSWYVLEERGSYAEWNPGRESEEIDVLLCYHVKTQRVVPFRLSNNKYTPVLALDSIAHNTSVNLQGSLVYIGKDILKDGEEQYSNLETISQFPGDEAGKILIHGIIFESSKYAIVYGRTPFEMSRGKEASIYLLYKREKNTFCVPIDEKVGKNRDSSISINGVSFQIEDDIKLLEAWMDELAERYIPKDRVDEIVAGKAEEVGRVIEKK